MNHRRTAKRVLDEALAGAAQCLADIAQDAGAPPGARVAAANSLLDRGGLARDAIELEREGFDRAMDLAATVLPDKHLAKLMLAMLVDGNSSFKSSTEQRGRIERLVDNPEVWEELEPIVLRAAERAWAAKVASMPEDPGDDHSV